MLKIWVSKREWLHMRDVCSDLGTFQRDTYEEGYIPAAIINEWPEDLTDCRIRDAGEVTVEYGSDGFAAHREYTLAPEPGIWLSQKEVNTMIARMSAEREVAAYGRK